ncbi:hypothetical protein BO70DRAFT_364361 [Aspergillus heteromorphus CBS 117.55]|uniref:Uncharacterized protein n=1 Tax=Aspergillus heteromorphus CBS 117.55 TaxID=1448321 RepID=A0A317VR65_9EURO|nr:uncharacterized protein BO70DRAFT_364361 [Aspergillus heteromorphus CBS 117.55]PWY74400.1 hypothetical protein BO70DRAFT_364361 [Aspergillus heteromorphus CBS 117.55]
MDVLGLAWLGLAWSGLIWSGLIILRTRRVSLDFYIASTVSLGVTDEWMDRRTDASASVMRCLLV